MPSQDKLLAGIEKARAAGDTAAVNVLTNMLARGRDPNEVRAEYEQKPFYLKIPQAAADVARLGTSGATLGGYDELVGGAHSMLTGDDYQTAQALTQARINESRARAGSAGTVAEVAGAASPIGLLAKAASLPVRGLASLAQDVPYVGQLGKTAVQKLGSVFSGGAAGGVAGGASAYEEGRSVPEGVATGILTGKLASSLGKYAPLATSAGIEGFSQFKDWARGEKKKKK